MHLSDARKQLMEPWTVRYLPDWFPGTEFKALANKSRDKFQISVDGSMEYVKNVMKVSPQSSPRSHFVQSSSIMVSPARGFPTP